MIDKKVSKYFSKLAKEGHKKHPRPREFYIEMGSKGGRNRGKRMKKSYPQVPL